MITEGDAAPAFELPAVVDGEFETVALADYLDDNVAVLAFYPADFNPSCSEERSGLADLALFTMQKDVSILGVSGDSLYSHRRFAEEYSLRIPLLADVDGAVAREYGVTVEDPRYQTRRAVFVLGPQGEVQFSWSAEELGDLPDVDVVREAVENVGGDDTAQARYRIGHAHHVEARRAFTSAMSAFDDTEWMMAQSDFAQAREEFEEAADLFDTAARFGTDKTEVTYFERAEDKAEALWRAADWLAGSANAFASGEGADGQHRREDAETPLETAREIPDPPDPDDFPPEEPPEDGDQQSFFTSAGGDTTLDADLDEATTAEAKAGGSETEPTAEDATDRAESAEASQEEEGDEESEDEIDEEELEEITAELEEQTAKAEAEREAEEFEERGDQESGALAPEATSDEESGEDIELDLSDPTAGEELDEGDEEESHEDENTDHGVPDSL